LPPSKVATIKAGQGVFYNLDKRRDAALANEPDINMGLWVLMGAPAASAELTPTHAALEFMGGFTTVHEVHTRDGFDYLDVGADLSIPDVPPTFGGVSGGGLWQVLMKRATTGEFSWEHKGLNLEGLAFYEFPPADGRRIIRCHGRRTIYGAMPGQTSMAKPDASGSGQEPAPPE